MPFTIPQKKGEKTMAISIDDYLNSVSAITAATQNVTAAGSTTAQTTSTTGDKDSYIASEVDPDAVLPSDNYNDILKVMQSAKAESASVSTDSDANAGSGAAASASADTEAVGGAGGGGGGSDEDDEDETTTEVVTINGVTYLETTTVSEGITTVTRTPIGGADE
jgi:hypothetical protein